MRTHNFDPAHRTDPISVSTADVDRGLPDDFRRAGLDPTQWDVFMSHSSADDACCTMLVETLRRIGLRPFADHISFTGRDWGLLASFSHKLIRVLLLTAHSAKDPEENVFNEVGKNKSHVIVVNMPPIDYNGDLPFANNFLRASWIPWNGMPDQLDRVAIAIKNQWQQLTDMPSGPVQPVAPAYVVHSRGPLICVSLAAGAPRFRERKAKLATALFNPRKGRWRLTDEQFTLFLQVLEEDAASGG